MSEEPEQVLAGGVGNAGQVVRVGDTVRRPWRPSSSATQAVLNRLGEVLPGVAPVPLGIHGKDEQGREVLSWLEGDVGISPFPGWVASEEFLAETGALLRRIHDALDGWRPPRDAVWSPELADPQGGPIIAHADVRPDNLVARTGRPVALLDWEFAAPGRRIWDLVSAARHCVPFTAPSRRDPVYGDYDDREIARRLRVLLTAYGVSSADRAGFAEVLDQRRIVGESFVRGRVARGEAAFARKWDTPDGEARLRAERDWIAAVQSGWA